MRDPLFESAVEKFVEAFTNGENLEPIWQELAASGLNEALLQRAVDRAAMLTDDLDD
jgi:hypothetical protein